MQFYPLFGLRILSKARALRALKMKKTKFTVSVVIPAYNEEKYLAQTLESLVEQKTDYDFEVVVVDNNSHDQTAQVALSFKNRLNIRVISEKKQGRGPARKRGFDQALGEIIVSLDADTIVYPDWLKVLVNNLKGETIATTTSCKIDDCSYFTRTIFNFFEPKVMILLRLLFGHFWLAGFSFAMLRSDYVKSGGFDPTLQAQEDLDLSLRVAKLGKIKFINQPVIFSGRRFKQSLLKGLYQYIATFIEAFFLNKKDIYLSNVR